MLLKNSVVVAAMLLLSPFTVVGRTLKADKSANKCEKRFEETIDALTTRIDKLTMLVEQIATSVRKNDKNDSAMSIAELCGQGLVANSGACSMFIEDDPNPNPAECVDACILLLGDIVNKMPDKCLADCFALISFNFQTNIVCNTFCSLAS